MQYGEICTKEKTDAGLRSALLFHAAIKTAMSTSNKDDDTTEEGKQRRLKDFLDSSPNSQLTYEELITKFKLGCFNDDSMTTSLVYDERFELESGSCIYVFQSGNFINGLCGCSKILKDGKIPGRDCLERACNVYRSYLEREVPALLRASQTLTQMQSSAGTPASQTSIPMQRSAGTQAHASQTLTQMQPGSQISNPTQSSAGTPAPKAASRMIPSAVKDMPGTIQTTHTPSKRMRIINKSSPQLNSSQEIPRVVPFDFDVFRNNPRGMMLMVLPRKSSHPHLQTFSPLELGLFQHKFSCSFVKAYYTIKEKHERFDYISNAIITWRNNCRIIKFHEDQKVYYDIDNEDLFVTIQNKLRKVKQKLDAEQVKRKLDTEQVQTFKRFCRKTPIESVYKNEQLYPMERIQEWTYLSIIHSLFSSFNFYVYPYSHRLKEGPENPVHERTKLKLKFPEYPNMFIIFHGRTVHCGAESKILSLSSTQASHDTRLFSYVTSRQSAVETATSIRQRNKGKEQSGEVDRDGLFICNEDTAECSSCTKSMHEDVVEIDLLAEYNSIVPQRKQQRQKIEMPFRILGSLDKYGFEVWHGENTRTLPNINLKGDIAYLEANEDWNRLDNNTNRRVLKVSRLSEIQGRKKKIQSDAIDRFVAVLESTVNDLVMPKRSNELGPVALLSNFGTCHEQLRHRDFKT